MLQYRAVGRTGLPGDSVPLRVVWGCRCEPVSVIIQHRSSAENFAKVCTISLVKYTAMNVCTNRFQCLLHNKKTKQFVFHYTNMPMQYATIFNGRSNDNF